MHPTYLLYHAMQSGDVDQLDLLFALPAGAARLRGAGGADRAPPKLRDYTLPLLWSRSAQEGTVATIAAASTTIAAVTITTIAASATSCAT